MRVTTIEAKEPSADRMAITEEKLNSHLILLTLTVDQAVLMEMNACVKLIALLLRNLHALRITGLVAGPRNQLIGLSRRSYRLCRFPPRCRRHRLWRSICPNRRRHLTMRSRRIHFGRPNTRLHLRCPRACWLQEQLRVRWLLEQLQLHHTLRRL